MREDGVVVTYDHHRRKKASNLQRITDRRSWFYGDHMVPFIGGESYLHGTSVQHHAYDRRAERLW